MDSEFERFYEHWTVISIMIYVLCGLIILNIYELDIAVFINAILKNKICAYEFRFELNFWCRFWVVWNGYFETLTPIPTMLLQTMPSLTFDVSEDFKLIFKS
jgi:hypothetical protein